MITSFKGICRYKFKVFLSLCGVYTFFVMDPKCLLLTLNVQKASSIIHPSTIFEFISIIVYSL